MGEIDVKELWEVLFPEQQPVDLTTMTELCFPSPTADHQAAVIRAFFKDRVYFKFSYDSFTPYSESQVEKIIQQKKDAERKSRMVEEGGKWLKQASSHANPALTENPAEFIEILKSCYLFGKESNRWELGKAMMARAGLDSDSRLFKLLVKLGVWDKNENLDLYRLDVPLFFSQETNKKADQLKTTARQFSDDNKRKDLTGLSVMTIDGQFTLDFDDAISIEREGLNYRVGVHIMDVGHYIKKDDAIDRDAGIRGASIYTPDKMISMLPGELSEDICSLKAGERRPAISIMALMSPLAQVIDYEILPSIIKVKHRRTYSETANIIREDEQISALHELAIQFRQRRLETGAIQISLPEINIHLDDNDEIIINRVDRESPGRMLVSEMMILANWLMAKFLRENNTPAIFRSQPGPKQRLLKNDQGTIFENWMQRKHLSRGLLGPRPEHHSGLGLDEYVTATSPIRKYFDLVTQRQIRSVFGLETPYNEDEIKSLLQVLKPSMMTVGKVQYMRNRYWILKYLEGKTGTKTDAVVVDKRKSHYMVMVPQYMMECKLPLSTGMDLRPGDLVQITVQHANARNDVLSVYLG